MQHFKPDRLDITQQSKSKTGTISYYLSVKMGGDVFTTVTVKVLKFRVAMAIPY